jgi:anti-sigma regulatory factor (Ser/Thr protein kinase)/putative methionine-R-sulfoxide reductase with GAF domain
MIPNTALPENTHFPVKEPGLTHLQLERLLRISRSLNSPPQSGRGSVELELEAFIDVLTSNAAEMTGCEAASILEMDETGQQLQFLALPAFQRDKLKSAKVPLNTSVAGWVFQNRKSAFIPDVTTGARLFKDTDPPNHSLMACDDVRNYTIVRDCRNYFAVPIIYHGEALGVLEVVNKAEHAHYTEEDLIILETIASQAAVAMQNTRLMVQVRHAVNQKNQLDRMKSDFIAITSHELRTPLGLILGHATFLQEFIEPEYQSQLEVIVRNAIRLKEIIDSITKMDTFQRGETSVRARMISIPRLVEEVMGSFHQEAISKGITLSSDTGQQELLVEGDATKIVIALSNLVKNAITFTNAGGHVSIVAGAMPGFVKVSVCDDGIGIPAKDLGHIFERFYQVESHLTRRYGGMGLG